jgi:hypothetical protein
VEIGLQVAVLARVVAVAVDITVVAAAELMAVCRALAVLRQPEELAVLHVADVLIFHSLVAMELLDLVAPEEALALIIRQVLIPDVREVLVVH